MVVSSQPRRARKACHICVLPLPSFPLNVQMRMAFTPTGSGHPGCIFGTFKGSNLQTCKRFIRSPFCSKPFRINTYKKYAKNASLTIFRINTYKSVSKQRTLSVIMSLTQMLYCDKFSTL